MKPFALTIASCVAVALVACGDDHDHDHDDDDGSQFICDGSENSYDPGEEVAGASFVLRIVEADPVPHTVDINTLRVQALDMQDNPLDDMEFLSVTPFTAKHDHGTPIETEVTPVGADGMYDFTNINYVHRGPWRLDITVREGTTEDFLQFVFCIRDPGFEDAGM